jgi:cell wall-active antibiotic response 4TMS protein YvqF
MAPRFSPEKLVIGVSLVAVGVIGAMARSGSLDFLSVVHTWWPVTLVLWGIAELYNTLVERAARGAR